MIKFNYMIIYYDDWNIMLYDKLFIGLFDLIINDKYLFYFIYLDIIIPLCIT